MAQDTTRCLWFQKEALSLRMVAEARGGSCKGQDSPETPSDPSLFHWVSLRTDLFKAGNQAKAALRR